MIMLNVDGEDLTTVISNLVRDGLVGDGDGDDDNSDVDDGGAGDQVPGKDRSTLFMSLVRGPPTAIAPMPNSKAKTPHAAKKQVADAQQERVYLSAAPHPPVGKLKKAKFERQ